MNLKSFYVLIPFLVLILSYQNCSQTDLGNAGLFKKCSGFLCDDTGVGNTSAMFIKETSELVLPYSGVFPLKYKVSGDCSDGGFKRNRIKARLSEQFNGESDCENGEQFVTESKCEKDSSGAGKFTLEFEIKNSSSLCSPESRSQSVTLQIDLTGIDNFDNEYNPDRASRGGLIVDIKRSIRPPIFNSRASGGADNLWKGTRVFATVSDIVNMFDIAGFCTHSASGENNKLDLHILPYGLPDSYRMTFTTANLECLPITGASSSVKAYASSLGYNGYFEKSGSLSLAYLSEGWPGLTGYAKNINSRNFSLILSQKDPNISQFFKLENSQNMVLKFNSKDNAQGWTVELLKQAQKQIKRMLGFSWDDSTVLDSDISNILNSGSPYPLRIWIYDSLYMIENYSTFIAYSSDISYNPFYDRFGKIAYGGKKCDSRLTGDMNNGISGSDGINVYGSNNLQQQRLALCTWYWIYHGLLDNNTVDSNSNWKNHWSAKMIEEGVIFSGPGVCKSASTGKSGDNTECTRLSNIFNKTNFYKNRFLGGSFKIYGDSGAAYKEYQREFNEAFAQYFVNLIMTEVSKNLVNSGTIAVSPNAFIDSLISNIFETSTNPTRLYGDNPPSFEKRKEIYPVEINLTTEPSFTPKPYQTYRYADSNGSITANGSENAAPNF